jgi:predicted Zn-dependent protease
MKPDPTRKPRWRLWAGLGLVALVALAGGGYMVGRELWARHHLRQAREALGRFDFEAADAHLEKCLEVRPRDGEARLLAAQTARRAGRPEEAARRLLQCEDLSVPEEDLRLERALLRAQEGDLAGKEGPLVEWAQRDSAKAPLIYEALARGNVRIHRVARVGYFCEKLLKDNPDHVPGLLCRGWLMEQLDRRLDALADYRRAVELRPDDVKARLSLGDALLFFEKPREALEHFEYLRERLPDNVTVQFGLARCLRGVEQVDQARQILDKLTRENPSEWLILRERGLLALGADQPKEAEVWLRRTLDLVPNDRLTNFSMYQCLVNQERSEEAAPFLKRADEIKADMKRLGDLNHEVAKPGPHPAERREAGLLCMRLGREELGEQYLLGSLQEDPNQPEAHQALAKYYDRIGQPQRAAWHRQQANASGASKTP